MKVLYKMNVTLGLIAILSGFTLALVYQKTELRIENNKMDGLKSSLLRLAPGMVKYSEVDIKGNRTFYLYDRDSNIISYAVIAKGNGYQGEIKILVLISKDLKYIKGIDILENVETPGLGGNIATRDFKGQFKDLKILSGIDYLKGKSPSKPNEIQAITGATISSAAVVNIINGALDVVVPKLKIDG